jgi:hypothetical protein
MGTIIGISIYILLGVIGYIMVRKAYLLRFNSWTVSDRNTHLFGILISVAFLVFGIFIYVDAHSDKFEDKESKW